MSSEARPSNPLGLGAVALDAIAVALVVIGAVRIAGLTLHRPIYGYANNFDFYRLAQWYGIGEDAIHPLGPHAEAPLAEYVLGGPRVAGNAYASSEVVFLWLSVVLSRTAAALVGGDTNAFDVRWIGGVRALALIAAGVAMTTAFRRRSRSAGLAAAATFALVLADPIATLFLNTLYADYSAVLFGFVSIAALALLNGHGEWSVSSILLTGTALLGLGLSKVQNQALPALLVAVTTLLWGLDRRLTRRMTTALGGLAAASLLALVVQNREPGPGLPEAIRMANATDTWFGAVLPALGAPRDTVARLGLPARCARYVGRTWYDAEMQPPPCPEVATLSRLSAVELLLREPRAARRLWERATLASRPTLVDGYGQVEGKPLARLAAEPTPLSLSVAGLTDALPLSTFRVLLFLVLCLMPAAVAAAVDDRRREPRLPTGGAHLLAALLGATALYSFGSSVLGDGLSGFQHHVLLSSLAFWPALATGLVWLRQLAARR